MADHTYVLISYANIVSGTNSELWSCLSNIITISPLLLKVFATCFYNVANFFVRCSLQLWHKCFPLAHTNRVSSIKKKRQLYDVGLVLFCSSLR